MDEPTIAMPVKQYSECIMALQKLEDIQRIVEVLMDETEAMFSVQAIRRITRKEGAGEQE